MSHNWLIGLFLSTNHNVIVEASYSFYLEITSATWDPLCTWGYNQPRKHHRAHSLRPSNLHEHSNHISSRVSIMQCRHHKAGVLHKQTITNRSRSTKWPPVFSNHVQEFHLCESYGQTTPNPNQKYQNHNKLINQPSPNSQFHSINTLSWPCRTWVKGRTAPAPSHYTWWHLTTLL